MNHVNELLHGDDEDFASMFEEFEQTTNKKKQSQTQEDESILSHKLMW